jgi:predicted SAM-dependent methyltransferase
MTWDDALGLSPLFLNLGGKRDAHPAEHYEHYISIDDFSEGSRGENPHTWMIDHDLRSGIPLPEGSVDRIHTEDFLHYLEQEEIEPLLQECYRVLKLGGFLRIAVPDYGHPKDRRFLLQGMDHRYPRHRTLTTKKLLQELLGCSPFRRWSFYHYWDGNSFVEHPIDYSCGWVRRTPEHDPRCHTVGSFRWMLWNFLFCLSRGFRVRESERPCLRGHRLHITSLVVDCFKD